MDRLLKAKLRSERGASITFALLLFLICTVVGVIVLVAGTTASGRISRLSEADARYYAVTSAADLLREEIDQDSVAVTVTRKVTKQYLKKTWTYADWPDYIEYEPVEGATYSAELSNAAGDPLPFDFLETAAKYCVFGNTIAEDFTNLTASSYSHNAGDAVSLDETGSTKTLTLTVFYMDFKNEEGISQGRVKVEVQMNKAGELLLVLSSAAKAGDTDNYNVTLVFSSIPDSDLEPHGAPLPEGNPPADPDAEGSPSSTLVPVVEEVKYDTISWRFARMINGVEG